MISLFAVNFRKLLKHFLNINTDESVLTVLIKNGSILRFNHLHGFWASSLLSQLELFKVLVFGKVCFNLIKLSLFCFIYFFFILLFFYFFSVFCLFCFFRCLDNSPQRKLPPVGVRVWVSFRVRARIRGEIFLVGNCPRTVFTGGKKGEFLYANEMLGFIHLLYVQSCTFL